jgi:ADP-ribosylglycohydrolase
MCFEPLVDKSNSQFYIKPFLELSMSQSLNLSSISEPFKSPQLPSGESSQSNGILMRICPLAIFLSTIDS